MAELTTIDGQQFHFDPGAVTAVADHDADTGEAVTTVYGLTSGHLRIDETVDGFLTRIGSANAFAELTRPDGSHVWVNGKAVKTLRAPLPGEYAPGVNTVVSVGTLIQGVLETPDAVKQAVNARGGKL